jgi:predicted DNA-binding transcriptional regulator YafY
MAKVAPQLFSRPPMERMLLIHGRIKNGTFPNCLQLAEEIEVSARTIKRDVDFMKIRLNMPIQFDGRRKGYRYTEPVEQFPAVPVSETELFALLVAHKVVSQYRGTPFAAPLHAAFQKLASQMNHENSLHLSQLEQTLSFHPFAPDDADFQIFEKVSQAIGNRRMLKFEYRKPAAKQGQARKVMPYHLACVDNRWYLVGHDMARHALRTFALARMQHPSVLATTFERPKEFSIEKYLKGSFGIFTGEDDFEVVIEFDAWASALVRERKWHPTQQVHELGGDQVRITLRLSNLPEIERWVLSWGAHATVIRPEALRISLRKAVSELAERYEAGGGLTRTDTTNATTAQSTLGLV